MDEVLSGAAAPVVTAVPAADAAPAPDATAAPVSEVPEGDKQPEPEKTLTQSEVNKLLAKEKSRVERRVERAIRAELRAELAEKQLAELRQPQAPAKPGQPKREDFKSDDEYAEAWVDYRVEQKIAARESKREQEGAAEREKREATERAHNLRDKMSAGREEYGEDFEERITGAVPFTKPMVAFLEDSAIAHKVAYHLASNVEEASRIADLSPVAQIRELDKLEAKLKAPPKTTQTPAPIVPNSGQGKVAKDYKDMSTAEHVEAWRNRKR